MNAALLNVSAIIPSIEEIEAMGRRRYQKPDIQQTKTKKKCNRRWYFRARVDVLVGPGEVKRKEAPPFYLGYCEEMGKREAEQIRDQILSETINKPAVVLQSQVLFGRILDEFMELARPEVGSQTAKNYDSLIECHMRDTFDRMRLCEMTPQFCQKWLQSLNKALARSTRKKCLNLFRQIWDRATDWNYTREICPLRRASLGPIEKGRSKTLPAVEQFHKILQALEDPMRSMLLVATFTGMRISEIRGIQRGDVKGDVLTIHRSVNQLNEVCEVKTEASWRTVPVGHLSSILSGRGPADEFLFDVPYRTAQKRLRAAGKAAGIEYEGFGWHTFRRASITWGRRAGVNQDDSMAQHGHTEKQTNNLYYVEDDVDLKRRAAQEASLFNAVMFGGSKGGRA